jgi:hypothetical protein
MAVMATWKQGINHIPGDPVVFPDKIAWKPLIDVQAVMDLKQVANKTDEHPDPCQVDQMRCYQYRHINDILSGPAVPTGDR